MVWIFIENEQSLTVLIFENKKIVLFLVIVLNNKIVLIDICSRHRKSY